MSKIGFISLGCAKNQVDLERLAGAMSAGSFTFTSDPLECDYMIVNTCGFIQNAVEEAIDNILSVKKEIPANAKLIVFGCMSERYAKDFASELPEVDFFAGVGSEAMQSVLNYISKDKTLNINEADRYLFNAPYYAYLKIAEGCNNRCTYCTIPSIRGNHLSVPEQDIISEAVKLVNAGVKELIVISQDTTKYGTDMKKSSLAEMLDKLASELPNTFFRVMYLNPDGVTKKITDVMKKHNNILRYFDIPVQSGSDNILKLMNRHYSRAHVDSVFSLIRTELPDAIIRTTLITGFPGETDEDFMECLDFLQKCKPDFAGFFPYSPEEGTKAAVMAGAVDAKTINKRLKSLQSVQKKNTLDKLRQLKKDEIVCYVEKPNVDFDFILEGRAIFQAPEIDGQLFVIGGEPADGYGPYVAKIKKIAYPDIYVELLRKL